MQKVWTNAQIDKQWGGSEPRLEHLCTTVPRTNLQCRAVATLPGSDHPTFGDPSNRQIGSPFIFGWVCKELLSTGNTNMRVGSCTVYKYKYRCSFKKIDSNPVFPHAFPTFEDHDHAADGNEGSGLPDGFDTHSFGEHRPHFESWTAMRRMPQPWQSDGPGICVAFLTRQGMKYI